jgi:predicted Zn-dependent protease
MPKPETNMRPAFPNKAETQMPVLTSARKPASGPARPLLAACAALCALAGHAVHTPAAAQIGQIKLVRDAETEALLKAYVTPLVRTARVGTGATRIFLINNPSFNAFVAGGRNIFVFTGSIVESKTPNELIGVLAHEVGHIAGGHLARQQMVMSQLGPVAIAGMLVGAGALIATTRSRNVGGSAIGIAGALTGPQEILRRAMLSYRRGEEQAADIAALKYLNATGQSARGLLTTMERMNRTHLFRTQGVDPYVMSHPLPADRLSFLRDKGRKSRFWNAQTSSSLRQRHALVRAKLIGFTTDFREINRRYPLSDRSLAARYARAVGTYRYGRLNDAVAQIDGLIRAQKRNPYFHELKGQALLEGGQPSRSLAPLKRALALNPRATPIRVMLGHALVSAGNSKRLKEAVKILSRATQQEPENAGAFQFLSMAYDGLGNRPMAQLSAAQTMFLAGRFLEARTQAARAKRGLKPRSPAWLKADDIMAYRPPKYR